mgnify:CR=1 FL=1
MPSSPANIEAPPPAGLQLTEGALVGEVPAGVHPGALSSNARAGAGDTNTTSAGDTNGAAAGDTNGAAAGDTNGADTGDTNGAAAGDTNGAAGDTNGAACALCELLAVKLGTGGGPCWPPAIHVVSP